MSNKIRVIHSSNISKSIQNDDTLSSYNGTSGDFRVLIVDDDKNSGESLRDIIEFRGHHITLLDEGMKFINRINEESFDVIFMDYHTNEISNVEQYNDLDSLHSINYQNKGSLQIDSKISIMGSKNSDFICNEDMDTNYLDSSNDALDEDEEITGTYITKLAHECYDFNSPIFAYTGDSSSEAIQDFQDSNFKGVFIKPVDAQLINSFFEIMEREKDDTETLTSFSNSTNSKLQRLAMKNNNFIFFRERRKRIINSKNK